MITKKKLQKQTKKNWMNEPHIKYIIPKILKIFCFFFYIFDENWFLSLIFIFFWIFKLCCIGIRRIQTFCFEDIIDIEVLHLKNKQTKIHNNKKKQFIKNNKIKT